MSEAEAALERIARAQQLKDAERMVNTLVLDEHGLWLKSTIEGLRKARVATSLSRGGVQSDVERVFNFRSPVAGHVLSGDHESLHYRTIKMPEGMTVYKAAGTSLRTWCFRVDNGLTRWELVYLHLAYNRDNQLVITREVSYATERRRAARRSMGAGPNRSTS